MQHTKMEILQGNIAYLCSYYSYIWKKNLCKTENGINLRVKAEIHSRTIYMQGASTASLQKENSNTSLPAPPIPPPSIASEMPVSFQYLYAELRRLYLQWNTTPAASMRLFCQWGWIQNDKCFLFNSFSFGVFVQYLVRYRHVLEFDLYIKIHSSMNIHIYISDIM